MFGWQVRTKSHQSQVWSRRRDYRTDRATIQGPHFCSLGWLATTGQSLHLFRAWFLLHVADRLVAITEIINFINVQQQHMLPRLCPDTVLLDRQGGTSIMIAGCQRSLYTKLDSHEDEVCNFVHCKVCQELYRIKSKRKRSLQNSNLSYACLICNAHVNWKLRETRLHVCFTTIRAILKL